MSVVFSGMFILLGARVFYLQVFKKNEILSNRRTFSRIKKLRGDIKARGGQIIASSSRGAKLFLKKDKVLTARETAELYKTAAIVVSKDNGGSARGIVSGFLSPGEQRKIKDILNPRDFSFISAQSRNYFDREIFAPVCGFTNYEDNGAAGVEYKFNDYLEGDTGEIMEVDATGNLFLSNDPDALHARGNDVYLTLDYILQKFFYDEVKRSAENYGAKGGYGIIMSPKTGEILAAVFCVRGGGDNFLKNPLVADSFEPGSTFKIVTVSAALENKTVSPEDKFFCEKGSFEFAGITIRDHEPYEWLTVKDIIRFSSNIGAGKIAARIGSNELYRMARAFGFGCQTGIKLPGETRGQLKRVNDWEKTSLHYIAFGQEVAATPIQMAQAFSVIANDGVLIQPRILSCVRNPNGKIINRPRSVRIRRVISKETALTVKEMFYNVVESGTAEKVRIPGWKICAKTGTAQKYDSKLRAYSEENYFSSLGGFLPMDDPRFVIFIGLDEPRGGYYGGLVCSEAFKNIAKKIIDYYGVPPDVKESDLLDAGKKKIVKNET